MLKVTDQKMFFINIAESNVIPIWRLYVIYIRICLYNSIEYQPYFFLSWVRFKIGNVLFSTVKKTMLIFHEIIILEDKLRINQY